MLPDRSNTVAVTLNSFSTSTKGPRGWGVHSVGNTTIVCGRHQAFGVHHGNCAAVAVIVLAEQLPGALHSGRGDVCSARYFEIVSLW